MLLGTTGVGGTPASARRRGVISPRGPPLSPWSRRAIRPNTVNVDSSQHLTGTLIQGSCGDVRIDGTSDERGRATGGGGLGFREPKYVWIRAGGKGLSADLQ